LHYRASYLNEPPASEPSLQDLIDALNRSVDATSIPITASLTRARNNLKLTEAIDLAGLNLDLTEGAWKARRRWWRDLWPSMEPKLGKWCLIP
jgi:hypothetical protein